MAGIGSILSIARSAMQAQQAAISVAGHNIANAQTVGYSKQTLALKANDPERRADGIFGTGVASAGIARAREALLDAQVRTTTGSSAGSAAQRDLLTQVEGILGGSADAALGGALDQFYNAWNDLAANPAAGASKANVRERGAVLAATLNGLATRLDVLKTSATGRALALATQVNSLTDQIASLNTQIMQGDASGNSANDLKDARDLLVDQLATIVPVTVFDNADGSVQVNIAGLAVVDRAATLTMRPTSAPPLGVTLGNSVEPLRLHDGALGHSLDFLNTSLPAVQARLDGLAAGLVADVNALHRTGWSPPSGAAGNWNPALPPTGSNITFFDDTTATATTAHGIRLSAEVDASANAIASGNVLNGPGNNAVALGIAGMRTTSASATTGANFTDDWRSLVQSVASQAERATDDATVNETLRSQAAERRTAVSGVSTDEELTNLMKAQQAYMAAAKLVTMVDELSRTLLSMTR